MITTKLYLDSRATKPDSPAILKIAVFYKSKTVYFPLGIKVFKKNFDTKSGRIIKLHNKDSLNCYIYQRKSEIDNLIFEYINKKIVFNNVYEIKDHILKDLNNSSDSTLFVNNFIDFINLKDNDTTKKIYSFTLKRLKDFDSEISTKKFEDITKNYLNRFESYLSLTSKSKNGRNVHLRNIRAIFNYAIDNDITQFYPFRTFKIRPIQTRKRSLSISDLRLLINYPLEPYLVKYRDLFMLDFYLIGINIIDLVHAKCIVNGRLEYTRAKTKRLYSIKIEPEAYSIIEKYKGKEYLLNILDDYKNYHDFLQRFNKNLKRIGEVEYLPHGKKVIKSIFPDLSSYWARHTWATIAASIDIPKDVIAHALGHGNNTVTDIYIDFDLKKVDKANRLVIDYVLG